MGPSDRQSEDVHGRVPEGEPARERDRDTVPGSRGMPFHGVFQHSRDAILLTRPDGRILAANPAACRLLGRTEEEICRLGRQGIVEPSDPRLPRLLEERERVGHARGPLLMVRADGSPWEVVVSSEVFAGDDGQPTTLMLLHDASESGPAREAREVGETSFRGLFELTTEGIAIHELVRDAEGGPIDYRILAVNPAFQKHIGRVPSSVEGRLATEVYGAGNPPFLAEYAEVVETGRPCHFEAFFPPLQRNFAISAFRPQPERFVTVFEDVTERTRSAETLRQSEERFRKAFEDGPIGMMITGPDFRFRRVNGSFVAFLGYTEEELLQRTFPDVTHPDHVGRDIEQIRLLIDGKIPLYRTEKRYIRKDGGVVWGKAAISILKSGSGETLGFLGMIEDITESRRLQAEHEAMEAKVRQQQKLEAIGTLASGVAHEINNPLSVMLNYAQLLQDAESDPATVKEYSGNIIKEGERVADIVKNLLAFARHEQEGSSEARLDEVVEGTLALTRTLFRKDQIAVEVRIPADLPTIRCRSQQIRQVLMNLLTNARDALNERYPTAAEGKTIRVDGRAIDKDGTPWVRLTVSDNGGGIPPEAAPRVFDPFFTTKPRDKGTGLGLAISYGIVKEHGGVLWFETGPGRGTDFHLDLPVDS